MLCFVFTCRSLIVWMRRRGSRGVVQGVGGVAVRGYELRLRFLSLLLLETDSSLSHPILPLSANSTSSHGPQRKGFLVVVLK